jgi:hypothetical protein
MEQLGKDKITWKEYNKGHQMISSEVTIPFIVLYVISNYG